MEGFGAVNELKTCPHCGAVITGTGDARPVGRPPRHSALDLQDCLGSHELTSGEFQRRAAETLDISRSSFYRLLDRGRREFLFRQRQADGRWISIVSKSQNGTEAVTSSLLDRISELADRALTEDP